VFSGYAPLSVRLAHILHRPGWRSISEVLNILPGPTKEEAQQVPGWLRKRRRDTHVANFALRLLKVVVLRLVAFWKAVIDVVKKCSTLAFHVHNSRIIYVQSICKHLAYALILLIG